MKKIILTIVFFATVSFANAAELSFTIPDNIATRVIDVICDKFGYGPASGLTKAQFAREALRKEIKEMVVQWEEQQKKETEGKAQREASEQEIDIQ